MEDEKENSTFFSHFFTFSEFLTAFLPTVTEYLKKSKATPASSNRPQSQPLSHTMTRMEAPGLRAGIHRCLKKLFKKEVHRFMVSHIF